MTKQQFLTELRGHLKALSTSELQELLQDYEAHFESGRQMGKNEEEIVRDLGDPFELAQEILNDRFEYVSFTGSEGKSMGNRILISIGLFFLNVCFAIPLGLAFWAVWFALTVSAVVLIASPLLLVLEVVTSGSLIAAKLFMAMSCIGLGLLLGIGVRALMSILKTSTMNYISWNFKMLEDS